MTPPAVSPSFQASPADSLEGGTATPLCVVCAKTIHTGHVCGRCSYKVNMEARSYGKARGPKVKTRKFKIEPMTGSIDF
jgi:hypothetical protein